MNRRDQKKILKTALLAAHFGAKVLRKYFKRLKSVSIKKGAGLVSEADHESEAVIKKIILKKFPHHHFLGEEGGYSFQKNDPAEGLWVVDPLDGTTNYVHGFPFFCISIGFEYRGNIEAAVVLAPELNYVYTATRGGGAFWNKKPIHVSRTEKIEDSLLATGFSYMRNQVLSKELETFKVFAERSRGLRRAGSAALDMCLVASGIYDGFWERELAPWDTAAGSLIVREAGGVVSNFEGEPFHYQMKSVVAGNNKIQRQISDLISQTVGTTA
ncbi:MAG: inositol monophosphatase [Oligoflexia bacterium]|nr:inositol monophosphatase [Oligoflexia bacterium]